MVRIPQSRQYCEVFGVIDAKSIKSGVQTIKYAQDKKIYSSTQRNPHPNHHYKNSSVRSRRCEMPRLLSLRSQIFAQSYY